MIGNLCGSNVRRKGDFFPDLSQKEGLAGGVRISKIGCGGQI
jgi:hypothetical protein